jgi:hypothetical protein
MDTVDEITGDSVLGDIANLADARRAVIEKG